MLASLITSKTNFKHFHKFFTHPDARGHLRGSAEELCYSINAVRIVVNKLEKAGLLTSGKWRPEDVVYHVNITNPSYLGMVSMV